MNIRQLEYFVKVYESGSFFKAADSLFISQQALSRALATLEQELNAQSFFTETIKALFQRRLDRNSMCPASLR